MYDTFGRKIAKYTVYTFIISHNDMPKPLILRLRGVHAQRAGAAFSWGEEHWRRDE
jgi:hypothetical protein